MENAILLVRQQLRERSATAIRHQVEATLLKLIVMQHPHLARPVPLSAPASGAIADAGTEVKESESADSTAAAEATVSPAAATSTQKAVDELKERLRNLELEALMVEVELPMSSGQGTQGGKGGSSSGPFSIDLSSLGGQLGSGQAISLERIMGSRKEKKSMTVSEVRLGNICVRES